MLKRSVIIHIGSHKTGTTTIQRFLYKNRQQLKEQNVQVTSSNYGMAKFSGLRAATCVPEIRRSLPFSVAGDLVRRGAFLKQITPEYQEAQKKKIRQMADAACKKNCRMIFSDETLSTFAEEETKNVKALFDHLFDDVTIILYLRRQPEFLVSYYYTRVSSGCSMSVDDHINMPSERSFLAYRRIAENWSIFGKENVKIRLFDKESFVENDLLSDFACAAGFSMNGLERVGNENLSSLDSDSIEFLRLLNIYRPKTDTTTIPSIDRSILKRAFVEAVGKNEKAYHLSRKEACHILDTHRADNNFIAQHYLGKETLFSDDISMYPEEVDSPHRLTTERCAELTAQMWKKSGSLSFLLERLIRNGGYFCYRMIKGLFEVR